MIEASELSVLLADKAPVLLECCWGSARKYQLYKQDHIPHAQFLDLKVLSGSDHVLGGTHITRPNDAKQLSEFLGQLGIRSLRLLFLLKINLFLFIGPPLNQL
jgi:3-mercaptopyruvate sulfurtransferase SseA